VIFHGIFQAFIVAYVGGLACECMAQALQSNLLSGIEALWEN